MEQQGAANGSPSGSGGSGIDFDLAAKITRLVQERGWNQEDFARQTRLNRHTVRLILQSDSSDGKGRRLRNATISQCAKALNLTVNELRTLPLERLLPRMHGRPAEDSDVVQSLYERARSQKLIDWLKRNGDRATRFSPEEVEELLSLQGPEGPLDRIGVEHVVELIERKRRLKQQIDAIAETEYLSLLEQLVELIHEKTHPGG